MRHADPGLTLWLAKDRISQDLRDAELARLVRQVLETRRGGEPSTLRRRAGKALIVFGERLAGGRVAGGRVAGEGRPVSDPRGLAARA